MKWRMKRRLIILLALGCLVFGAPSLQAADFLRMESSYLGNGWFQYRVTLADDPYFEAASISAFSISFPGRTEYGVGPADWSSSDAVAGEANWTADTQQVQARPYERTFLVRSSHTTFKTVDQAVRFVGLATPKTQLQSAQVPVGAVFLQLRGVVPCPPGEADNSSAVHQSSAALRQDLRITALTVVAGVPASLSYEWPYDSTVSLEGSFDFVTWTPIVMISGDAGLTTWNATVPLENSGRFFRLALIANEKMP